MALPLCAMPLGALSQASVSAEATLSPGWRLTGVMLFGEERIAFSNGPDPDEHIEASGDRAVQALARLADALREPRGSVVG